MTELMPINNVSRGPAADRSREFAIANRTCRSCGHMHALSPYIRLARASTGIEGESSDLDLILRGSSSVGHRRCLIAGSGYRAHGAVARAAERVSSKLPSLIGADRRLSAAGVSHRLGHYRLKPWSRI